jgi:6-phosphofructokinase 1
MGNAAIETILTEKHDNEPVLIGLLGNRIAKSPLMQCVEQTCSVAEALEKLDFDKAMGLRSSSFKEAFHTFVTLMRSLPHPPQTGQRRMKIGIMNSGSPAPGMNTASRAAVRLALDKGHIAELIMVSVIDGDIQVELDIVHGWACMVVRLGTNRKVPKIRTYACRILKNMK